MQFACINVAFGVIPKKLFPSPLSHAERKHGNRRRALGHRPITFKDKEGAAVGQAGYHKGCYKAKHH